MSGCTPAVAPAQDAAGSPPSEIVAISPLTRAGIHYKLAAAVENGAVADAQIGSGSWQGLELIVAGRDPRDAALFMQRWSGSCPVAQAVAARMALEQICGGVIPGSARALRNLMQGASFVAAHLTHFYQQAVPDYVQGPDSAPYAPRYAKSDLRLGPDDSAALADEASASLEHVRGCHEMIAMFGGRSPQPRTIVPGGVAHAPTLEELRAFLDSLRKLRVFVESSYLPRVYKLAAAYKSNLFSFGQGYKNVISAGALPLTDNRLQQVFSRGVYSGGKYAPMDARQIKTFLRYARFDTAGTGLGFRDGVSAPQPEKKDGYSFVKAARYQGLPMETGPLARMWITNPEISPAGRQAANRNFGLNVRVFRDFGESVAFSLMGRHIARAEECFYILSFMERWLQEAVPGRETIQKLSMPEGGEGVGLTETPQGMLIHYLRVEAGIIARYQVIAPEMWNVSPKDDLGQRGVIEQALVGAPVPDAANPVNLGRLARSFGI